MLKYVISELADSSSSVRLNIEFNFSESAELVIERNRSSVGVETSYLWGSYEKNKIFAKHLTLTEKTLINSWWLSNTPLTANLTDSSFSIDNASYDNVFINQTEEINPYGLYISPNGLDMYIVGETNKTVYQYLLGTAWDISTAVYTSKLKLVSAQELLPDSIWFTNDGLAMYMIGRVNDDIYQYTLTTPWDVSTANYASKSVNCSGQDTAVYDFHFHPDGLSFFIIGQITQKVYKYELTIPFDVSTASYANVSVDVSDKVTGIPTAIKFNGDGSKMFLLDVNNKELYQYGLSTSWDITTATYDNVFYNLFPVDENPTGIFFKPDGTKMYSIGIQTDSIYQHSITPGTVTGILNVRISNKNKPIDKVDLPYSSFYNGTIELSTY